MTPLNIACRKCAQQPGEWCLSSAGKSMENWIHAERIEDEACWERENPVSKEGFEQAVIDADVI